MRFKRMCKEYVYIKSSQKLAAIRRRHKKALEALPLFAEEMANDLVAPEKVLQLQQDYFYRRIQEDRDIRAREWKEARARLNALDPESKTIILANWQNSKVPAKPEYLKDAIWCYFNKSDHVAPYVLKGLAKLQPAQQKAFQGIFAMSNP